MSVTQKLALEPQPGTAPEVPRPDVSAPMKSRFVARLERKLKAWLAEQPLQKKFVWVVALVSNAVLFTAVAIFFACDFLSEVARLRASGAALGRVIAANCRTSLSYGYKQSAAAMFESFADHPTVVGAALYQADGAIFAQSARLKKVLAIKIPADMAGGASMSLGSIRYVEPVVENGKRLGTLIIESDMGPLYRRVEFYAIGSIVVLIVASIFGRKLTSRLSGVIVKPVMELSSVAGAVAETGDYGLRAAKFGGDEVGQLVDRFNTMLGEIQKRDEAISEAQLDLETKVLERTSELHHRMVEGKRNEELIRENENRYRNLFENNPMPMFVMDLESLDFVAVNNAAIKHYGYSQEEFLRLSLPSITTGADYSAVIRAFRSNAKSFNAGEWTHRRKQGGDVEVELTAHAIMFSGKVAKIVLANDVTARNAAQRQLVELHRKLMETSRQAGMAEVATGVLHNVGNVLNSVNVSATVLADSVKKTKAGSLKRVVDLLEANRADLSLFFAPGGKGQMLPSYLATLNDQIAVEQEARLSELAQLTKNISHIKDIVAMQQSYAKVTGVLENHSPHVLLNEAIQLSAAENGRARVALEWSCPADMAEVMIDRHKVMQILVNLITNARQATVEQPEGKRLISISAKDTGGMVRISVRDNGCGIPSENLTRIFNHGFTTKKDGHGFGLHSAANAAKEMGGGLVAESDGAGCGAVFHLDMPIRSLTSTTSNR